MPGPLRGATGGLLAVALLLAALPLAAGERAQTLADIRAEMAALAGEIGSLRAELAPGTGAGAEEGPADSVLDRVAALERALQRLTARTEELEFRIERIVTDATARLGDMEFRLVELEGGDVAALGPPAPLGGTAPAAPPDGAAEAAPSGPLLAVGERDAFEAAAAAHAAGDWDSAAAQLEAFAETYPGGPLTARAHRLRAEALEQAGRPADAARAWLAAFNAAPEGAEAPAALLGLGRALAGLGSREEGCIMLDELRARFPDSAPAAAAGPARAEIGCP